MNRTRRHEKEEGFVEILECPRQRALNESSATVESLFKFLWPAADDIAIDR